MRNRILDINPKARVRIYNFFFLPENAEEFPFDQYDYVVDAVDTVTAKIGLVMKAEEYRVPVISSMGAGNKLDGSRFRVADLYETKVCPLAKVMRRELRRRGIEKLKVVYSEEEPIRPRNNRESPADVPSSSEPGSDEEGTSVRSRGIPGSAAFVPSAAGLIIAGEVVKDLVSVCPSAV